LDLPHRDSHWRVLGMNEDPSSGYRPRSGRVPCPIRCQQCRSRARPVDEAQDLGFRLSNVINAFKPSSVHSNCSRIDDDPLSDNFLRLISPDMFPYLKSLKVLLPVQDAKRGREFLPDKARGIWKWWLTCVIHWASAYIYPKGSPSG